MRDVKKVIQSGGTTFLEAPTGFGKTIALLCASLPSKVPIFYASRTHAQMFQVMVEARKIYDKGFPVTAAVIGSRNQLCLDPKLRRSKSYVGTCEECLSRLETSKGKKTFENLTGNDMVEFKLPSIAEFCAFAGRRIRVLHDIPKGLPPIMSIEDFIEYGEKHNVCPYYLAHKVAEKRQLVVGSYNYLFWGSPLTQKIAILDEAHNIEDLCKNRMSVVINERLIKLGLENLQSVEGDYIPELQEVLKKLLDFLKKSSFEEKDITNRKALLLEMGKYDIGTDIFSALPNLLLLTRKLQQDLIQKQKRVIMQETMPTTRVLEFLKTFIEVGSTSHVGIWRKTSNGRELEWYCLDAGLGFNTLLTQDPIAVILTSGTLSPIEGQAFRLGVPNAICKVYGAVVPSENILLLVLDHGPNGVPLTTQYRKRNQIEIIEEYGKALKEIVQYVPNGTLVFFPSYGFMQHALQMWESQKIGLDEISTESIETQTTNITKVVDAYKKKARTTKAILHAVVRGKLSEGYNFPDKEGRAAIILGIPYPDYSDPKIQAQISYYDKRKQGYGQEWYSDIAMRTVNQSLGRVWRHKNDYAVGFILDQRFLDSYLLRKISPWIQERMHVIPSDMNFSEALGPLRQFFHSDSQS
jgi:Rad3-related DNA helicase